MLIVLSIGGVVLYYVHHSFKQSAHEKRILLLRQEQNKVVNQFTSSISNFATLISGVKSYIDISPEMPDGIELQTFIKGQLEYGNYGKDLVMSFIDTTHTFQFVFTKNAIDPGNLVGTSVSEIRDENEINKLNEMLGSDEIRMYEPINLKEGWLGIPLDFRVVKNGKVIGYMASILNLENVLDEIYDNFNSERYLLRFSMEDSVMFDRFAIYNGTKVYHNKTDVENIQKADNQNVDYSYEVVDLYGQKISIGISLKNTPQDFDAQTLLLMSWYLSLVLFVVIGIIQWFYVKRINESLILNVKFNEKITALSPTHLYIFDIPKQENVFENKNIAQFLDFEKGESLSTSEVIKDHLHHEYREEVENRFLRYAKMKDGDAFVASVMLKTKHGNWKWFSGKEVVFNRSEDGSPIQILGMAEDITQAKLSEDLLLQRNDELERINTELDRFVYSVTHDLKAPLSNMQGLINLVKLENDPDRLMEYCPIMESSVNKMQDFINELIIYARNANAEVQKKVVDLRGILSELVEDHKYTAGAEKINFSVEISENSKVLSDASRIRIIFNNLISNAIKYHDYSKKNLFVKIRGFRDKEGTHIRVIDNGTGMEREHAEKIFGMFYRVAENTSEVTGSGIGLFIVNEVLKKIGGSISVESTPHEGTTFTVLIPD